MTKVNHNLTAEQKRQRRVRHNITGTLERPRVTVNRSNKHILVQVIDDVAQVTIAASGDLSIKATGTKLEKARQVAEKIAAALADKNISKVAFDRGSYRYHGRVKMIAEVLREKGIQV